MEVITENGKDYLVTYVAKIDNHTLDAQALFVDLKDALDQIVEKTNRKNGTRLVYLKDGYGSNLQSLWNRFSGDFFSPSFLKSYMTNPALNLMQQFFTTGINDANAIGDTFHKIMEAYYMLPKEDRNRFKLFDFAKQYTPEGQDINKVMEYLEGYSTIKDYMHPRSELDDTKLECKTEHRGRANNLYVKSIKYVLPCAVSYVVDRIDYRDNDVVLLDYKTGKHHDDSESFDGYLGSMILYKWAMEQELNTEITRGYLIFPGEKKKYYPLDYSIEAEEKMAEIVTKFYQDFMRDNRFREYHYTDLGYFTSEEAQAFQEVMNDNLIWRAKLPLKIYIGEHEDTVL